jgi:hypothetical protein
MRRRWLRGTCGVASLVTLAGIGVVGSARAAGDVVNASADSFTYQTNGPVASVVSVGGTVYIGGDFSAVRPGGAAVGEPVARAGLAAFSATTGTLLDWDPGTDGSVQAMAASPDGSTIYVGGDFTHLAGAPRHTFGAVSSRSGVARSITADTNGTVRAIAAAGHRIYLGGTFTAVRDRPRSHVAALQLSGALARRWRPTADAGVRAITLSPDRRYVYLGGDFKNVNGHHHQRVAKLSRSHADILPWRSHPTFPVYEVVATARRVYVGGNGAGGHVASYSTSGVRRWISQPDGGVQTVALRDGILYVGGHFDAVCPTAATTKESNGQCPTPRLTRRKIAALHAGTGDLTAWDPGANSLLGVLALTSTKTRLLVGGAFTVIGGQPHQGYAQFSVG